MEKKVSSSAKTPEKNTSEPLYTVAELAESSEKVFGKDAVSYTHLTLPTIA